MDSQRCLLCKGASGFHLSAGLQMRVAAQIVLGDYVRTILNTSAALPVSLFHEADVRAVWRQLPRRFGLDPVGLVSLSAAPRGVC